METRRCTRCESRFDPYAHRAMLPRLTRRWWQLSDEMAVYTCPRCGAMHRLALPVWAVASVLVVGAGGVVAMFLVRAHAVAMASAASILALSIARLGLRMEAIGPPR